ncbi:hypothetical protein [Helicobacter macacae]|uniref:hypothetical protein n=1 Tax=Helicobacter macacae TaxID=398626 RepID=UPI0003F4AE91|nr:hypothetical protein [Helicobacter macacae]
MNRIESFYTLGGIYKVVQSSANERIEAAGKDSCATYFIKSKTYNAVLFSREFGL